MNEIKANKNITMTSKDSEYVFGNTVYIVTSHFREDSDTVSEIVERLAIREIDRNLSENIRNSA